MHTFKHSAQLSYAYLDLNQKWVLKSAFEYFWKMFLLKNEKRTVKEILWEEFILFSKKLNSIKVMGIMQQCKYQQCKYMLYSQESSLRTQPYFIS